MSNRKQLTPSDLRKYKGLENLTDEQAEKLHDQLKQFAATLLRVYPLEKVIQEIEQKNTSHES